MEEKDKEEEALSVRNMNYRICLWVFLSASISLACFLLVLSAIIVNYAPYRPIVAVYWCALAIYMFSMCVLPLIFKCCYSTQSIEGDYENLGPSPPLPMRKRTEFRFAVASIVLCFVVFISVMCCLSVIFPESFHPTSSDIIVRVASVSHAHAVLFLRLPGQTYTMLQVSEEDKATSTIQVELNAQLDYTKFVIVPNLLPNTTYRFSMDDLHQGKFTTFPLPNKPSKFSFYFGGKYMPHFPSFGTDNRGWNDLHDQLEASSALGFILFLGDFIFADHPWYKGNTLQAYASHYRQTLRNAHRTLANFPSFFMYGQHDSFAADTGDRAVAMQAWDAYLGGGNPQQQHQRYYTFDYGDVSFFVLDTTAHAVRNVTMLGSKQKLDLLAWLRSSSTARFKFLASPVPWTRALDGEDTSWDFAFQERNEILQYIQIERISGCVFLSMSSQMVFSKAELGFQGSNMFEFGSSVLDAPTRGVTFPWRRRTNETKAKFWKTFVESGFANTLVMVNVDTIRSDPELQIKFYLRNETVHVETLRLSDLQPGTQAPTQISVERNDDNDAGDVDEDDYEYDKVFFE